MSRSPNPKSEKARALAHVQTLWPSDPEALTRWPWLHDLLMPRYEGDACTRRPGTMRIEAKGTCWVVTLTCPSEGMQCFISLDTLHECFDAVEKVLCSGRLHWAETWEQQKRARQAR